MSDFSLSSWVFELVNTKWDIMTFSVLGRWRSPNGKLQMLFCILKMSLQSISVPPASKTNLFQKIQIMTPRVCSGVDVSLSLPRLPCASEALSVPSQLYPGQDKSRALCDWHGSISLESCLTHSSACMLAGFSAVCFHVLHFGVVNASLQFYFRGNYAVCGSWMISWKYKKSEQNPALMQSEDVITGLDDCSSSYSFLRKRADHAAYLCINCFSPILDRMTHE